MKLLPNYHIFTITPIAETNERGACVEIKSQLHPQKIRIPYTNDPGASTPSIDTARIYLESNGFELIGRGESPAGYFLISDTFEPLKPQK